MIYFSIYLKNVWLETSELVLCWVWTSSKQISVSSKLIICPSLQSFLITSVVFDFVFINLKIKDIHSNISLFLINKI